MTFRGILKFTSASAGLFALSLFAWLPDTPEVHGQEAPKARPAVKLVFSVDFPLGGKERYLEWVSKVAKDLAAPAEVRGITSYDNYYGASPHRVVEFEFDSMVEAGKYLANPKIKAILEDVPNYGLRARVQILRLRSDYARK